MLRFPSPLHPGDLIAVPAPSSGVTGAAAARLDAALAHLVRQGFRVVEGCNLRSQCRDASAGATQRAAELQGFLQDPAVAAILPPWGGELASDILDLIDFVQLRQLPPKWVLGYSDISTLLLPLTLVSGWATAHGPNLMELTPENDDRLTTGALPALATPGDATLMQVASTHHQTRWGNFATQAHAAFALTEPTRWQCLDGTDSAIEVHGRLIGGCLDTIAWLAGTPYGDIPGFIRQHRDEGVLLYLENVEFSPPALVRVLLSLRRHGWFDGISGLLFGRSAAPAITDARHLNHLDALRRVCGDMPCPVLYDLDIGHQPPQLTLINGAAACLRLADGGGTLSQHLGP